jgi:hypothetical protein
MKPDIMIFILPMFALFIPIVAIIMGYFEKKAKMKVVEKAIEHGTSLNGLVLDEKKPRMPYRSGMISLAVGLGTAIFGIFVGQNDPEALNPLVGMSSIMILIGAALLINDKINYARYFEKDKDKPRND